MKKFLSPEESLNLLKLGLPSRYITYYACEDGRFDTINHEYLTYFGIRHKIEITGPIQEKYKPVLSVADLIKCLTEFNIDLINVLEDQKWNFNSYEYEDNNELIDYLHKYILNYLKEYPQTPDYIEPKPVEPIITTSATVNLDNPIYFSIDEDN